MKTVYPYSLEGLQLALKEQCDTDSQVKQESIRPVRNWGNLGGELQEEIRFETEDGRSFTAIAKGHSVVVPYENHYRLSEFVSVTEIV